MKKPDVISNTIYYHMTDLYEVGAIYHHGDSLIFRVLPKKDPADAFQVLRRRLKPIGFRAVSKEDPPGFLISVTEQPWHRRIPPLNAILFGATLLTMFFAPLFYTRLSLADITSREFILDRLEFTVALILILLFHEFGHYLAGRRRGILMSLPYFIPAPNFVGTFGAIIKSRSPFYNRRDLIEVGAAGPIAGFVMAIAVLIYGLQGAVISRSGGGLILGDSLLIKFMAGLIVGPLPEGYDYALPSAALAGWVGLLITTINLLPLGQLDGGHIVYGMIGRRQYSISYVFLAAMLVMGFWWPGWWLFGALTFLFGLKHPPTLNDDQRLSKSTGLMGATAILIFILCFVPVPFRL